MDQSCEVLFVLLREKLPVVTAGPLFVSSQRDLRFGMRPPIGTIMEEPFTEEGALGANGILGRSLKGRSQVLTSYPKKTTANLISEESRSGWSFQENSLQAARTS